MLQQEFEERTKMQVTPEEYHEIEKMYNEASENIDKDTFCKDWMKHRDSLLLKDIFTQLQNRNGCIKRMSEERERLVDVMLSKADEYEDCCLLTQVVGMIGMAETIKRKIQKEYALTHDELEYIKANLK